MGWTAASALVSASVSVGSLWLVVEGGFGVGVGVGLSFGCGAAGEGFLRLALARRFPVEGRFLCVPEEAGAGGVEVMLRIILVIYCGEGFIRWDLVSVQA